MKISRRKFLKTTGIVGSSIVTATGCRPTFITQVLGEAGEEKLIIKSEKWVKSICLQCCGGCGIQVRVINGNAVKIEGNPVYPSNLGKICPKGIAGLQVLYDPDRIKTPLKRIGRRGGNKWISIDWDEAIKIVAKRLIKIRNEGHPYSLAIIGGREQGKMQEFLKRFLEAFGSPNYIGNGSISADGSKLAHYFTQGWGEYAGYDWENTNYLLCFGGSLIEAWRPTTMLLRMYGHMRRERTTNRTKIVYIDPRFSITAAKADEWIPINPGADGALALGISHVIIKEGLYDKEFIKNHTFGFNSWSDENGEKHIGFDEMVLEDYPPEKVSKITGINSETIIRIAREFASNKPSLASGERGASMQSNGIFNRMAIHSLNALVGNINSAGGVLRQKKPSLTPWPNLVRDKIAEKGLSMPRIDGAGTAKYPFAENAYGAVPDEINNGRSYRIDTLFIYYTNPLFSAPNNRRFYEAFEKIPFIVSFSPFMDESTNMADLILPDHTYLERWQDDILCPSLGFPVFGIRQPVVDPLYNTMNTGDVIIKIANTIGGSVTQAFPWNCYLDVIKYLVKGIWESKKGSIVTNTFDEFWEKLLENGGWWESTHKFSEWHEVFATPTGKFEFYSQILKKKFLSSIEAKTHEKISTHKPEIEKMAKGIKLTVQGDRIFMPHYEPIRVVGNKEDYPFHFITYKTMTHAEGRGANQPWLQESFGLHVNENWEPWVEINPKQAKRLGIDDGDEVWVESVIGRIKVKARLFPGSKPDLLSMPFEYGHKNYGRWAKNRGENPNEILANEYDYLGALSSFSSTRVKIYKA